MSNSNPSSDILSVKLLPTMPSLCYSRSQLTSSDRRQETAELRRMWKQSRQRKPVARQTMSVSLPTIQIGNVSCTRLVTDSCTYNLATERQLSGPDYGLLRDKDEQQSLPPLYERKVSKRPSFVFRVQLPEQAVREKWRPAPTKVTNRHGSLRANTKDSKYFFINPDWGSEKHTLEKFRETGDLECLKYSWM